MPRKKKIRIKCIERAGRFIVLNQDNLYVIKDFDGDEERANWLRRYDYKPAEKTITFIGVPFQKPLAQFLEELEGVKA